jgi:hypothetical protein
MGTATHLMLQLAGWIWLVGFLIAVLTVTLGAVVIFVRTILSDHLTVNLKFWWLILQLGTYPFASLLYMVTVEKSRIWKLLGAISFVALLGFGIQYFFDPKFAHQLDERLAHHATTPNGG